MSAKEWLNRIELHFGSSGVDSCRIQDFVADAMFANVKLYQRLGREKTKKPDSVRRRSAPGEARLFQMAVEILSDGILRVGDNDSPPEYSPMLLEAVRAAFPPPPPSEDPRPTLNIVLPEQARTYVDFAIGLLSAVAAQKRLQESDGHGSTSEMLANFFQLTGKKAITTSFVRVGLSIWSEATQISVSDFKLGNPYQFQGKTLSFLMALAQPIQGMLPRGVAGLSGSTLRNYAAQQIDIARRMGGHWLLEDFEKLAW